MQTCSSSIRCTRPYIGMPSPSCIADFGPRNLSSSSSPRPRTPPSTSSSRHRMPETTPPPQRGALASSSSPPFKSYINFLSNTNDDWKADEDEMLGYEDDDGDDFGLPSLSNMKRRSKRIATQNNRSDPWQEALSPVGDGSFGRIPARRYSNSADIAAERPASTYPMPKKSEGKILRPQYKDILKGKNGGSWLRRLLTPSADP